MACPCEGAHEYLGYAARLRTQGMYRQSHHHLVLFSPLGLLVIGAYVSRPKIANLPYLRDMLETPRPPSYSSGYYTSCTQVRGWLTHRHPRCCVRLDAQS